ncbi:MAG: LamG-like jellyroll fold domain-containing protein, partial [Candidatus Hinthialibacter sp.]
MMSFGRLLSEAMMQRNAFLSSGQTNIAWTRIVNVGRFYSVLFCLLLSLGIDQAEGQDSRRNLVMSFDGDGDYLQLPADVFCGLDSFTVEAWFRWESFGYFSQPWSFGSSETSDIIGLNNEHYSSTLQFFIYEGWVLQLIQIPEILEKEAWRHIAAVYDREEMRLYLNGVLAGRHKYRRDNLLNFPPKENFIGKSHWPSNEDFRGQIDEFRIWSAARTEKDIRDSMFVRLTGEEDHLAGLWNFDAGNGADSTVHKYDGIVYGDARCVEADLPAEDELPLPSALSGKIVDSENHPLQNVNVVLTQDAETIATTTTNSDGHYKMVFFPDAAPYDLAATRIDQGNWRLQFHVNPGESRIMDLTLRPAVSITGALSAYDNSPLSGLPIQALQETERGAYRKTTVLSDENGQYQFVNLRPGKCRLRCYVGDHYVYFGRDENAEFTPKDSEFPPIELGRTIRDCDFCFAPFKKGVWRSYLYLDGLASNHVTAIEDDGMGRIWFGTDAGISRFDGVNFLTLTKQDGLISNEIQTLYRDMDGGLWIGTYEGLSRFNGRKF